MTEPAGPADAGPADLTEVVVGSEIVHQGHYLTFRVDTVERADGSRARRDVVGHPGAVAVLAIDPDDRVLLVRQWRSPAGRALLEVPAGTLDVDPATGLVEDHALAARRELEEETGYRAGSWRLLTSFWTAPGFATELMHLYLATDLTPADGDRLEPDEDERLELERVPWQEAIAAVERGEIADGKSLVALLWLDRLTEPASEPATAGAAPARAGAVPSDTPGVRIDFTVSTAEAVDAAMIATRRSRSAQVLGLFGVLSGAALLVAFADPVGFVPLVIGLLMVSGLVAAPFILAYLARRRDLVAPPTAVTFRPDGVEHETFRGRSRLTWETFTRLRETSRFIFFETGLTVLYIPKRAFTTDQLAAFRQLAAAARFGPDGRRMGGPSGSGAAPA